MIDPAEKSDIERLEGILCSIQERLASLEAGQGLNQEWYTLRQAARLKRGVELRRNRKNGEVEVLESFCHTLRVKYWLRPNGGTPEAKIGGAQVWHRDTILDWLRLTDAQLEALRKAS